MKDHTLDEAMGRKRMPMTLSQRLARFVADVEYADLSAAVIDKAKACLLHFLGVGIAGAESGAALVARGTVEREEGRASAAARLMLSGTGVGRSAAAFVNSVMGHAKLQEDAYLTASHPGVTVIPAALAAADGQAMAGSDLLTAIVCGYEAQCAITDGFIPRSNARGFRSSPIYGVFGATIAAAKLMRLDEAALVHALGLAATFASGTFESSGGGMISILQVAQAARNGVFAALLAREGAAASPLALEGEHGFYRAFTGAEITDPGPITGHLGQTWKILDVTLKRYPTAMFNQPPTHVMLELTQAYDLTPDDITQIIVEMNSFETTYPTTGFHHPTAAEGDMSLGSTAYAVACACVNRGMAIGRRRPAGWSTPMDGMERHPHHPMCMALAQRVRVIGSELIRPLSPRLTVQRRHGPTVVGMMSHAEAFRFGFEEDAQVIRGLVSEMALPAAQVERLVASVRQLEQLSDVDQLLALTIAAEKVAS